MGLGDCDGDPRNGCESDLRADPNHCGGCGLPCVPGLGVLETGCAGARCRVEACLPGLSDCDGLAETGCEADLQESVHHCGACGVACLPAGADGGTVAQVACVAGACDVAECAEGRVDRDGDPANGCEYVCTVRLDGVEVCDGRDGDCDGVGDPDGCLASDLSEGAGWAVVEGWEACGDRTAESGLAADHDALEGETSLRLTTTGGEGTWAVFPADGDGRLVLDDATWLHVWVRGDTRTTWESEHAQVRVRWRGGETTTWTTARPFPATWQEWWVPLAAPVTEEEPGAWVRRGPTPAEAGGVALALHVGGDPVGCGFTLWLDGVRLARR